MIHRSMLMDVVDMIDDVIIPNGYDALGMASGKQRYKQGSVGLQSYSRRRRKERLNRQLKATNLRYETRDSWGG